MVLKLFLFCYFFVLALFEYIAIFPSMPVSDMVQYAQPFFLKFFNVSVAGYAAPPEMINNDFYLWLQLLPAHLFAQLCRLFSNNLGYMPKIKLMIYFTLLFTHVTNCFCQSVVRLEIGRPYPLRCPYTCFRPSNSIPTEFPAVITREQLKSRINPEVFSRTVHVLYLALWPG